MTGQVATFNLTGMSDRDRGGRRVSRAALVILVSLAHVVLFLLATRSFEANRSAIVVPVPIAVRWIEFPAEAEPTAPSLKTEYPPASVVTRTEVRHPAVTSPMKPRVKTIHLPAIPHPVEGSPNLSARANAPSAASEISESAPNSTSGASREEDTSPLTPPRVDAAYLSNPAPDYPADARRAHQEGMVLLRVLVAADGHAQDISIERSCGFPALDAAAAAAVGKWRFSPGRRRDTAVDAWVLIPILFKLRS
jgi:protein TonB